MQLPGLGRMMNFHVVPHTEEGSRLDIYMSRCMLKLCSDFYCPSCNCHALQLLLCRHLCDGTGGGGHQPSVYTTQRGDDVVRSARRARELLNDLLACEAGPSLAVADLRELQGAAGLVRSVRVAHACAAPLLSGHKQSHHHGCCVVTCYFYRHSYFGGSAVPALPPFWDGAS